MLDKVREQSKSVVTYLIVAGIIFVFVAYFGPGSQSCVGGSDTAAFAASVNGVPIPMATFENAYGQEYRSYQARGGGMFTPEMAEQLRLRENVLDRLVTRELFSQVSSRMGIQISDDELGEEIRKRRDFQKDGQFDAETYRLMLQYMRTTASIFEADFRKDLLAQKVAASIMATAKVSDDEVQAEFVRDSERVNLEFVRFASAQFRHDVGDATPDEAAKWAEQHLDKVKEFFDRNQFRYSKPPRVFARQVLVRVDEDAAEDKVSAARKKIDGAKAELGAGKDFGEVAARFSDDATNKDKGGHMGEVSKGLRGRTFDEAVFATPPGKTTEVFRDQQGFHVVRVEQSFPELKKALDEVKVEIASELIKDDKAKELAKKAAEQTLAKVASGEKLQDQWPSTKKEGGEDSQFKFDLGSSKPETDETGEFSPSGEFVPRIGVAPDMVTAAFAPADEKTKDAINRVFEVNNAFYVVAVKARTRADPAQMATKMTELRERARRRKGEQLMETFVKQLKDQGRIERNLTLFAPKDTKDA